MKIAILSDRIPPENVGGAGRVAWSLASGLHAAGHAVYVIAATNGASCEEMRDGTPTYHLHSHIPDRWLNWLNLYNPQTIRPLRQLLERLRPDVISAHNVHHDVSYASLHVARQLDIPVVFTAHDMMSVAYSKLTHFIHSVPPDYRLPRGYNLRQMRLRYNPFRNPIIRYILTHDVARRVCVSQIHRAALIANGLPDFQVVYNGVDPAHYAIPASAIQSYRAGFDNRPIILFAGRLSHEKGGVLLLDAFAQVLQKAPAALLVILAPQQATLDHMLTAHTDLRASIRFGGWLDGQALLTAFCAADVVAVPSVFFESFGMVAAEAMAARKPVVASPFGALHELVSDGQTGYIVNPFDTAAFADKLSRLLLDQSLARQMGIAGHTRLINNFTLGRQVQAMESIFAEVVQT